jgi:hypothetical protein
MPSNLYRLALEALSDDEKATLAEFETWMEALQIDVGGRKTQGDHVLGNLREESHLLGEGAFGDCSELVSLLKCCCEEHARSSSDSERYNGFGGVCGSHEGKGLRIDRERLPDTLLRYGRNMALFEKLVANVLGDRARKDLINGRISFEEAFSRLVASWDPSAVADHVRLGGSTVVFATFDHSAGAPRSDAAALAQALALPVQPGRKEILMEFTYPTDSVANHRFPTVADAGWAHEFQPAPDAAPDPVRDETHWGWTRPLGAGPAQPELVHDNQSLRVLSAPPRFVGRYSA